MQIYNDNFVAVFVNTKDHPVSRKFLGIYTEERESYGSTVGYELNVWGIFEEKYQHPDGPKGIFIPLETTLLILTVTPHDKEWPAIYMFHQSQINALKAIKNSLDATLIYG